MSPKQFVPPSICKTNMNQKAILDPNFWTATASLVVATASALLAWRSFRTAARALALSERQEKRREPKLKIFYSDGYRRLDANLQLFGFLVTISNPSDIDNSVARAELQIISDLGEGVETVLRVQHDTALSQLPGGHSYGDARAFSLPFRVDAHQAESGWFLFGLKNELIGEGTVVRHTRILEDTHGVPTSTDRIMVRSWVNES